jgi:hypothetical protein
MDNTDSIYFAASGLLHGIIQLVVIVACIILVAKQKSSATILMLVGQILALLFSMGGYVWNFVAARDGVDSLLMANKIMALLGPLPYAIFAIGLVLYATNQVKKKHLEQESA